MKNIDRAILIQRFSSLINHINNLDNKDTKKEMHNTIKDILKTHCKADILYKKDIDEILGITD